MQPKVCTFVPQGAFQKRLSGRRKEVYKGAWWMPRLTEAMKDVISCDKPRVGANSP